MGSPTALAPYLDVVFNVPTEGPFTYLRAGGKDGTEDLFGRRVTASFGRRTLTGFVVGARAERAGAYEIKAIDRVIDAEPLFDEEYLELARWIAGMYFCSLGEALSTMLPGGRRESRLPVLSGEEDLPSGRHALSAGQQAAVAGILSEAPERSSYLFGVTGSGKTEVYLVAAERTIERGRGVIYLVPEISLTHQLVEVVRARFRDRVAVLHSGLTPSQKFVEWMRIRRGEASLVIGARSAVFAPVPSLGLIVIDEEHESTYKSSNAPRYHARQVAMRRCAVSGARLVLGSATPSVEAYHLAREGRMRRYVLTERLSGGRMPEVQVVDMKDEEGSLSRPLCEEIRRTRDEGRQTILFLNRRGFSYFFHCRSCGFEMTCSRCSVSLTYHKELNRMVCHYCGYSRKPIDVCPECGSLDVGYSGFGTELIEEEVARRFPDLRTARVDTDSIRTKGSLQRTLRDFRDAKIDLLLGTQMVAKGLNFPGVRLVGIVLADTGLHLPDFRAQERTFSLILQVSGRAGRYVPDGKVVIQTYRPQNEAVMFAAANQIDSFYSRELQAREALRFPPYVRLFRLVFRGRDREKVKACALDVASRLASRLETGREARTPDEEASEARRGTEILGPAECPIAMISSNYRCQLLVRTERFASLHAAVGQVLSGFKPPRNVYVEVDVDPVSLL